MRIDKIDFLRFFGLSLIIMAHVQPPIWLFQLRNFDVPLMFMVMGMSFRANENKYTSKSKYIISRFKRLVLPAWAFILLFLLINNIAGFIFNADNFKFSYEFIFSAFVMSDGVGYLWVLRLFFLVSVIAILVPKSLLRVDFRVLFLSSIVIIAVNSYILHGMYRGLDSLNGALLMGSLISKLIPYLIMFIVGYKFLNSSDHELKQIAKIAFYLFIIQFIFFTIYKNKFVPTQTDKASPGYYYLSYAIFASTWLYLLSDKIINLIKKTGVWPIISFISKNTIWIYLWHIIFLTLCHKNNISFLYSYMLTYLSAVTAACIQFKVIRIITVGMKNQTLAKNIHIIFIG